MGLIWWSQRAVGQPGLYDPFLTGPPGTVGRGAGLGRPAMPVIALIGTLRPRLVQGRSKNYRSPRA